MRCPWCDYDFAPGAINYVPNEYTVYLPGAMWRKLNQGVPMTEPRDPLLVEREKTHGSFAQNAKVSQKLKDIFHGLYGTTCVEHQEALDMIALKLSRILSGQANFRDHWRDLSGYALLAMEACDEDTQVQK